MQAEIHTRHELCVLSMFDQQWGLVDVPHMNIHVIAAWSYDGGTVWRKFDFFDRISVSIKDFNRNFEISKIPNPDRLVSWGSRNQLLVLIEVYWHYFTLMSLNTGDVLLRQTVIP